jgi:hypothetical protein
MPSARLTVGSMTGLLRRAAMKCGLRCARAPWLLLVTALLATTAGRPALSDDQSVTFKGMTINIDVGFGPGGGYDLYARVLARHLGKYLPGNPTAIVRNMPGGGSLRVANYIYSVAPKDGSELGAIAASAAMDSLMGNDQAAFDIAKFGWVGSMDQDVSFCGVWDRPENPKTFQEMLTRETTFGLVRRSRLSVDFPAPRRRTSRCSVAKSRQAARCSHPRS